LPRNSVVNSNNSNNSNSRNKKKTKYLPIGHSEEPRTKGDFSRQRPDAAVSGFCKEQNTGRKLIFLLHRMVCPLEQTWQNFNPVLGRTFLVPFIPAPSCRHRRPCPHAPVLCSAFSPRPMDDVMNQALCDEPPHIA
jgi:hypothetical protein